VLLSCRSRPAAVTVAAEQAAAERARGGCKGLCQDREKDERIARAALLTVQNNRAATLRAAELDRQIEEAEAAVGNGNTVDTAKEADPQSASMAKAIGADQNLIAALSHAVFAISIELGCGSEGGNRAGNSNALVPIDRRGAVDLQVIDDKPAEIVERFFLKVMRPRLNGRVQSMAVWTAYQVWCAQGGYSAVSHAMFGRLARWRKDRVGGTVWYLDAELAEGYVGLAPVSAPKALPEPATIAKGTPTAH
jgi:hypothetical protein